MSTYIRRLKSIARRNGSRFHLVVDEVEPWGFAQLAVVQLALWLYNQRYCDIVSHCARLRDVVWLLCERGPRPEGPPRLANGARHMARKKDAAIEIPQEEPMPLCMGETLEAIDEQIESDIAKPRSVVRTAYKEKYRDRAVEAGTARKAAKRSTWDWLAQTLAGECLVGKDRIDIDRFLAVLDANAVDHSRWTNRAKGWEGRLRMTGRLALQRVVAEAGTLSLPDGETLEAPAEWVAKFRN